MPEPFPAVDTVNAYCLRVKVAVTLLAASIVTLQAPVPKQAPDQPPNCEPEAGVAVRDTTLPAAYVPLTGAGLAVIVPEPTVDRLRMNCDGGFTVSVAVWVSSPRVAVMVTVVALRAATATAVDIAFVTILDAVGAVELAQSAIVADVARGASGIETTQRAVDGIGIIDEPVAIIVDSVVAFILP